jgi:hypothetical protein
MAAPGKGGNDAPLIVIRNVSRRYRRGVDDVHARDNVALPRLLTRLKKAERR